MKAAIASELVIKSGQFELEPNFADIFKNIKTNRSREHILVKRLG